MIKKIKVRKPIKKVEKGWGSEVWIVNSNEYCGKLLHFNAGAEFSFHYHIEKTETFYILSGVCELEYFDLKTSDKKIDTLIRGMVVDIPSGNPHKIRAIEETSVIEISTHHKDSDSYRIGKGDSQK